MKTDQDSQDTNDPPENLLESDVELDDPEDEPMADPREDMPSGGGHTTLSDV